MGGACSNYDALCTCEACRKRDEGTKDGCGQDYKGCTCRTCVVHDLKYGHNSYGRFRLGSPGVFLQARSVKVSSRNATAAVRLEKVVVKVDNIVTQVIFCFDDGTKTFVYGNCDRRSSSDEGSMKVFEIKKGDYISEIRELVGKHLHNIQFITKQGQVSPVFGQQFFDSTFPVRVLKAAAGHEVVGLFGSLETIVRPCDGPLPAKILYTTQGYISLNQAGTDCYAYCNHDGQSVSLEKLEIPVAVYTSDLKWLASRPDLDRNTKKGIQKLLEKSVGSGLIFTAKIAAASLLTQLEPVKKAILKEVGEKALLPGLSTLFGQNGVRGVGEWLLNMVGSHKAAPIISGFAGVLVSHICAPIYAIEGKGVEAAGAAAGPVMALGAAAVGGAGAALAVGFAVPAVMAAIFHCCGETGSQLDLRWKHDALKMFEDVSSPLNEELNRGCQGHGLRCPQGHVLIDMGPLTLKYARGGLPIFASHKCGASFDGCTVEHSRWQFRFARFLCPHCGIEYCEPCMLKHLKDKIHLPVQANV